MSAIIAAFSAWLKAAYGRIPTLGPGAVQLLYGGYVLCSMAMFALSYFTGSWATWLLLAPLWVGAMVIGRSAVEVQRAAGDWDTDEALAIHSFKGDLRFVGNAPLLFFWAGLIANAVQRPAPSLIADACWCAATALICLPDAAIVAKFGRSATAREARST